MEKYDAVYLRINAVAVLIRTAVNFCVLERTICVGVIVFENSFEVASATVENRMIGKS
jgi:hypothetical protein